MKKQCTGRENNAPTRKKVFYVLNIMVKSVKRYLGIHRILNLLPYLFFYFLPYNATNS